MNEPTRAAENIARRILACEADEDDPPQSHAASRAVEKLHPYLTKYVGAAGFHALLVRALSLAKAQVPWLASVQVKADATLAGFDEAVQVGDVGDARKGGAALLTELLGLLVTFLGEAITLHMVQEVWSGARLDELNFSARESTR